MNNKEFDDTNENFSSVSIVKKRVDYIFNEYGFDGCESGFGVDNSVDRRVVDDDGALIDSLVNSEIRRHEAWCAIVEYYAVRKMARKAGFAGIGEGIRGQPSRKKANIDDQMNGLEKLIEACEFMSAQESLETKPVRKLKVISPVSHCSDAAAEKTSRKKENEKKRKKYTRRVQRIFDVPEVRDLPKDYVDRIHESNNAREITLIAQKQLTASDLNPDLNRLLLNAKSLQIKGDFLYHDELERMKNKVTKHHITTRLIEPSIAHPSIELTMMNMESNSYFALLKPWKDVFRLNNFAVDDVVQVWSFRFDDADKEKLLGVAIVPIFKAPRESSPVRCSNVCSS